MTDNPLNFPDLNAVFQPRQPYQNDSTASGSDKCGFARATINDGHVTIETGKALQASTADTINSQNASAGVPWETAQDPVYRSRQSPGQVTEDSILTFPNGAECTLRQAREMGLVGTDNKATTRPFDEGQQQEQEEVHPDLAFDLLADEAVDRDYSALVETTAGIEQQQAIQQVVETGEIDARTLSALASQLHVEPDQLQGRIAPIMEAFKQQALDVMSEGGLSGDAVVAWAQQHKADAFQKAMHQQGTMRQTGGYAALRTEYLETLDEHSPSVALNAELGSGCSQYQNAKGQIMVRVPGMSEMRWKTAIKSFGVGKK